MLDKDIVIKERIALINSFDYERYRSLTKTKILVDTKYYYYQQEFCKVKKVGNVEKEDFYELIDALNYFSSISFVHGDLNKKNIIYTEVGFKIIDYEPSLLQIKEGQKQFMVTKPYISRFDLKNDTITRRTDKLSFFYFVLRSNKVFSAKQIVDLCGTLDHTKYTQMSEESFVQLSYNEILERAYDFKHNTQNTSNYFQNETE